MPWPSMRSPAVRKRLRNALRTAAACALFGGAAMAAADPAEWTVIGRQGIVSLVLVPNAQATDRIAYDREIDRLCPPGQTCFLNFYTNSQGLVVTVPLPDGIASEATATFRRSTKQGAQMFMWSCRLKVSSDACF